MARPPKSEPSYCRDKSSNRAFVTLNGKRKYLGEWKTQASRDAYDIEIGRWKARDRQPEQAKEKEPVVRGPTVSIIIAEFMEHAATYYRHPDGTPTSEFGNLRDALKPLHGLFGAIPAAEFGPLALAEVQREMIGMKWCRTHINRQIARIRVLFKWAVSKQKIPQQVRDALSSVKGLAPGRSDAEESAPVKPVPDAMLAATLPFLSRHVRAMVDLQLLTGARAGELVTMRTCDIDRSGKVWVYKPIQHKGLHRGHVREIRLGPKAQEVLKPFLKMDQQRFIFSPSEAEAERREKQHAKRKTPIDQGNKPGEIHRRFRDRYTVTTFRRAITRACEAAFGMPAELREPRTKEAIEAEMKLSEDVRKQRRAERMAKRSEWRDAHTWHPHQLRHNSATILRRQYGIEAARLILGHRSSAVTEIYAEMDASKAEQIMAEVG